MAARISQRQSFWRPSSSAFRICRSCSRSTRFARRSPAGSRTAPGSRRPAGRSCSPAGRGSPRTRRGPSASVDRVDAGLVGPGERRRRPARRRRSSRRACGRPVARSGIVDGVGRARGSLDEVARRVGPGRFEARRAAPPSAARTSTTARAGCRPGPSRWPARRAAPCPIAFSITAGSPPSNRATTRASPSAAVVEPPILPEVDLGEVVELGAGEGGEQRVVEGDLAEHRRRGRPAASSTSQGGDARRARRASHGPPERRDHDEHGPAPVARTAASRRAFSAEVSAARTISGGATDPAPIASGRRRATRSSTRHGPARGVLEDPAEVVEQAVGSSAASSPTKRTVASSVGSVGEVERVVERVGVAPERGAIRPRRAAGGRGTRTTRLSPGGT